MLSQEALKIAVAQAAADALGNQEIIGVGTGSTIQHFIECLKPHKHKIDAAVASSEATAQQLQNIGIPVRSLNEVGTLPLYIDSADEYNPQKELLKGGGGALTREKVLATHSQKFICIVDESKHVDILGSFPVAVEVIPMARSAVARQLIQLKGNPVYRQNFITDNGNEILDVYGLNMTNPSWLENAIKALPGVVENGIFAKRKANEILVASQKGILSL